MIRTLGLAIGMVMIFAVTVLVLLTVMPGPHKPTDYLVIGCVATLLCLLLLFVVLISTKPNRDGPNRDREGADNPSEPPA